MATPQILQEIASFLSHACCVASAEHDEGRRNSQLDEDTVIALLQAEFGEDVIVREPKVRWWYDFAVIHDGNFYPVNYKSTKILATQGGARPDNAGQKLGMLYALTTIDTVEVEMDGKPGYKLLDVPASLGEDKFQHLLLNNAGDAERDYYYLVQNKVDTSEVLIVGLRDTVIADTPRNSAYNLPFQVDWRDNRDTDTRTFAEAWDHIVGRYRNNVQALVSMVDTILHVPDITDIIKEKATDVATGTE